MPDLYVTVHKRASSVAVKTHGRGSRHLHVYNPWDAHFCAVIRRNQTKLFERFVCLRRFTLRGEYDAPMSCRKCDSPIPRAWVNPSQRSHLFISRHIAIQPKNQPKIKTATVESTLSLSARARVQIAPETCDFLLLNGTSNGRFQFNERHQLFHPRAQ